MTPSQPTASPLKTKSNGTVTHSNDPLKKATPMTAPANATATANVPAARGSDDLFDSLSSSGKYLPRLQMFGAKSEAVGAGKIKMAHFGIVVGKDSIQDLGPEIQIVAYAWRPKALSTGGDEIITSYDHESPIFKQIQEMSDVSDSGAMFGPDFLVWIPAAKKWASLFMSSKTARREAPAIRDRIEMPSTLGTEFIRTKKYSWHGIVCKPCSSPFDFPSQESIDEQTDKFMNPPIEEVAEAAPATPARDR